jgi:hypothetical protein
MMLPSTSFAQGMGSGTSAFRNSGFGSSGFGSSGFGSGFGSSGFGSSGFGRSGFGSSGFGSSGFGNGFGGGVGNGFGSGFGNSGFGNSGFGGGGFGNGFGGNGQYGGGQNFVGRDAADMQGTFNQMGRAGAQFFNQMNRNMSRESNRRRQSNNNQANQNPPQPMRVEVKVAFNAPRPSPAQMSTAIRTRLAKILTEHRMSMPGVAMEGDTVVLTGMAASENERDVITQLLALEPGVRDVRNEMTVAAPATAALVPPQGN